MSEAPKNCPFCGRVPIWDESLAWCAGSISEPHRPLEMRISEWNRRADLSPLPAIAMRDAAVEAIVVRSTTAATQDWDTIDVASAQGLIRALPLPPPDALLAAALALPEVKALLASSRQLHSDMMERAQAKMDVIYGEQYRIVNCGATAWSEFSAALAALKGDAK